MSVPLQNSSYSYRSFLKDNFEVKYNSTGEEDLSIALNKAEVVVIGEKHCCSHRIAHNQLIERIFSANSLVLVEEKPSKYFDGDKLPSQLWHLNKTIANQLNIGGWDDENVRALLGAELKKNTLLIKEIEAGEQKFHESVLAAINKLGDVPERSSGNSDLARRYTGSVLKFIKMQVQAAEANNRLSNIALENLSRLNDEILSKFVCLNEGWVLRTNSLISSLKKALGSYEKVIVLGGMSHFYPKSVEIHDPELSKTIESSCQKLFRLFKTRKVVALSVKVPEGNEPCLGINKRFDTYVQNRSQRQLMYCYLNQLFLFGGASEEIRDEILKNIQIVSTCRANGNH